MADISADNVKGIGFDATCSLVAIDKTGSPVTVSPTGIFQNFSNLNKIFIHCLNFYFYRRR